MNENQNNNSNQNTSSQQGPMMPPVNNVNNGNFQGPRSTNTMAILSLVFAFIFAPLGIVFGAIGLNQIKKSGEEGKGLAIAGLVTSSVFTLIGLLYIVFIVIAIIAAASSSPSYY